MEKQAGKQKPRNTKGYREHTWSVEILLPLGTLNWLQTVGE